jgi:hypothetical protein
MELCRDIILTLRAEGDLSVEIVFRVCLGFDVGGSLIIVFDSYLEVSCGIERFTPTKVPCLAIGFFSECFSSVLRLR